jgi:glycine betaine/choline ABC-type transport system substrate-binding protein
MPPRAGRQLRPGWTRPALALLVALSLATLASACGGSGNSSVTLTIASRNTPEEEVLTHIYVQALRKAGYEVKGDFGYNTAYRYAPLEGLQDGSISGYPEHLNGALSALFNFKDKELPNNPQDAYDLVRTEFSKAGLTALPPTPYSLSRPVTLLTKTAKEHHLRTVSDLKGQAEKMSLLGFTDCHFRLDCLAGIERSYQIYFDGISYMYTKSEIQNRYRALEDGEFDALITYSTDGQLAGGEGKFIALEDDKHVFPAGNAIFVTSPKVVEEAGPDFEATIVAAQKGLTLPVMQQLDAEVELEKKDPAEVAAGYLKRVGHGR